MTCLPIKIKNHEFLTQRDLIDYKKVLIYIIIDDLINIYNIYHLSIIYASTENASLSTFDKHEEFKENLKQKLIWKVVILFAIITACGIILGL